MANYFNYYFIFLLLVLKSLKMYTTGLYVNCLYVFWKPMLKGTEFRCHKTYSISPVKFIRLFIAHVSGITYSWEKYSNVTFIFALNDT